MIEKYGEDARLIYNLDDQGGGICSLRFDLTVPFARWLAMNNFTQVKRYQIAKVYRRDQPAIARGRLREFYQCDFDIAGNYDPMIPDAEILHIIIEVFDALELDVTVRINHRRILDGLFAAAGVPDEKIRLISSAVDKLDKISWADVKREMVDEKGLADEVADQIGEYVRRCGDIDEMLQFLKSDSRLVANENIKAGLDDMTLLASYLEAFSVSNRVSFDLSLARGLDYYTGVIFEVINKSSNRVGVLAPSKEEIPSAELRSDSREQASQVGVGSIAAGGRYDNLVGMYVKNPIPCVGISFGVDRIYTILETQREKAPALLKREVDVYIIAMGGKGPDGLLLERMKVAGQLWKAGIRAEFAAKVKPRLPSQFNAAKDMAITIILGQDELTGGQVRLKALKAGDNEKDRGQLVSIVNLVEEVKKLL